MHPPPCKLTFDLLTLKVVSKSRVTWATYVPILVFLGLSVLDLGPMYATDRQTSDTHHQGICQTANICQASSHSPKHRSHDLWRWKQNSYNCPLYCNGKNSVKKIPGQRRDPDQHQTECLFTSETAHSSKNFIRSHRQLLELSAKFREKIPYPAIVKIPF